MKDRPAPLKIHDDVTTYDVYIVQGVLAVNPKRAEWCTVLASAVPGWQHSWKDLAGRVGSYHGGQFWSDSLAFFNKKGALAALKMAKAAARKKGSQFKPSELRVIRRTMMQVDTPV